MNGTSIINKTSESLWNRNYIVWAGLYFYFPQVSLFLSWQISILTPRTMPSLQYNSITICCWLLSLEKVHVRFRQHQGDEACGEFLGWSWFLGIQEFWLSCCFNSQETLTTKWQLSYWNKYHRVIQLDWGLWKHLDHSLVKNFDY